MEPPADPLPAAMSDPNSSPVLPLTEDHVAKMKVSALRDALKVRGMFTRGLKVDLVTWLKNELSQGVSFME